MATAYDIIIRPIITERAMAGAADKKYVFEVARDGWIADYDDPLTFLEIFKSDNGNNDYLDRLVAILRGHADAPPRSLTILRMSVPCCGGLEHLAHAAVRQAGLDIVPQIHVISLG